MTVLRDTELADALAGLPQWAVEDGMLARSITFPDVLVAA